MSLPEGNEYGQDLNLRCQRRLLYIQSTIPENRVHNSCLSETYS